MQEELTALQSLIDTLIEFCVNYSFQVVGALIVLFLGFMAADWTRGLLLKVFEKKSLDITLSKFIAGGVKIIVIAFVLIIALGKFGITIAPFIAAFSALAFGASFAIQGPLSNYGAGISIILSRPFVVGNTITVADQSGVVEEIKLAATILTNEDGVKITIPNNMFIVGEVIYNSHKNKIVEGVIGISYSAKPEQAIQAIGEVLSGNENVNKEKKWKIGIQEFADSSVNIGYRYWVPTIKFFETSYNVNQQIYKAFNERGINIPFPQRDVHVISQPAQA